MSDSNCQTTNYEKLIGFDAKNKDSLSSYICSICHLLFRYPCQLYCGHRFCRSCLDQKESCIKCTICNEETLRDRVMVDRGCQLDMDKIEIYCSMCEWHGVFKNYQEHLKTSHSNPSCSYCSQQFDSPNSLLQHTSVCGMIPIECAFKPFGCNQQFLRMNAKEHFASEEHHLTLLKYLMKQRSNPTNPITTCENNRMDDEGMDINGQELHEMLDHIAGSVQAINDDTQRLSAKSMMHQNALQKFSDDLSRLKLSVQETDSLLNGHKANQQTLEQTLASIQQDISDLKMTSYDGTLMWKITNFREKMTDAQSERQTSIYSPPFYSSPNGYKMRLRLYLAGDGNARRSHVSLFFVLMRGEYDAVLQFPFSYKITFCLLDQTLQKRHIIDSFRPDVKSNSFQRPRSDMNIASGIPKFCPLTAIQADNNPYVQDDTMLIKVFVDFTVLPKTVLPHIFTINPGLPTVNQHELIKREIEKQTKESSLDSSQMDASVS